MERRGSSPKPITLDRLAIKRGWKVPFATAADLALPLATAPRRGRPENAPHRAVAV